MNAFTADYTEDDDVVILDEDEAPSRDERPGQKYAWVYALITKLRPGQFMFVPDSERARQTQLIASLRSQQSKRNISAKRWKMADGRIGVAVWKEDPKEQDRQKR